MISAPQSLQSKQCETIKSKPHPHKKAAPLDAICKEAAFCCYMNYSCTLGSFLDTVILFSERIASGKTTVRRDSDIPYAALQDRKPTHTAQGVPLQAPPARHHQHTTKAEEGEGKPPRKQRYAGKKG